MTISAVTDATTSATPTTTSGLTGTKDEFLKLFMAQLQHQDPLNPQSGADMVAQLAQMTQVEQSAQMSSELGNLAASQASMSSSQMAGLIGHTCDSAIGSFTMQPTGTPPPIDVTSGSPTKGASLVIADANGKELRRIPIPDGTTTSSLAWDGRDSAGNRLAPGSYQMTVDAGGSSSAVDARWHGRVDAVEITPDGPRLRFGGILVAPATIATIGGLADVVTTSILSQGAQR